MLVTKAKIKRAKSSNLKGSSKNKLHRRLTLKCPCLARVCNACHLYLYSEALAHPRLSGQLSR